jgi:putative FmdB family regulatory protein
MPTYEYQCRSCGHELELFQSMKDAPKRKCPQCRKSALERKIGLGAAILFKGSGFYQTDYRSASYKKAADADKPADAKTPDSKPAPSKQEAVQTSSADAKTAAQPKPAGKTPAKPRDAA